MSAWSCWTCNLGLVEYREAVAIQERLRARVQAGELPDLLLLLQHPPVYTLGRRSEPGELPVGHDIPVVDTERGGKLTYHGPGQLVGYPIMHVDNVREFVGTMERALVEAVRGAGVPAGTREGREFTGIWVGDRKIGSIGIHVSRRVSMHGFAVNVDNDLDAVHQRRRLRAPRRPHDLAARGGLARGHRLLPQARRARLRAGLRPPPADRHPAPHRRLRADRDLGSIEVRGTGGCSPCRARDKAIALLLVPFVVVVGGLLRARGRGERRRHGADGERALGTARRRIPRVPAAPARRLTLSAASERGRTHGRRR